MDGINREGMFLTVSKAVTEHTMQNGQSELRELKAMDECHESDENIVRAAARQEK